jgi:Uma2 family endonuclease
MATTTTAVTIPLDAYLKSTYRPDRDWIDGEVRERNMGEAPHSAVQKFLIAYISAREEQWGITIWPEQRVQTSATRFRVPDICVTRETAPFERIFTAAPLLCIEIMSYEDRLSEILERAEDYLAMGVPVVWIIDPRRRSAYIVEDAGLVPAAEWLAVRGYPVEVSLPQVFAYLDKMEARK